LGVVDAVDDDMRATIIVRDGRLKFYALQLVDEAKVEASSEPRRSYVILRVCPQLTHDWRQRSAQVPQF
jgi:hypothetical protein